MLNEPTPGQGVRNRLRPHALRGQFPGSAPCLLSVQTRIFPWGGPARRRQHAEHPCGPGFASLPLRSTMRRGSDSGGDGLSFGMSPISASAGAARHRGMRARFVASGKRDLAGADRLDQLWRSRRDDAPALDALSPTISNKPAVSMVDGEGGAAAPTLPLHAVLVGPVARSRSACTDRAPSR